MVLQVPLVWARNLAPPVKLLRLSKATGGDRSSTCEWGTDAYASGAVAVQDLAMAPQWLT